MKEYPAWIRIGGPILGLLMVIFLINAGVGRLQADQAALREEVRQAQFEVQAPEEAPAEEAAPAEDAASAEEAAPAEDAAPAEEATPAEEAAPAEEVAPAEEATSALSGEELQTTATAAINKGTCIACHTISSVPGAVGVLGPNLDNIGATAETRVEGLSTQEYLYQSILDPNAFIAPACPLGPCLPNVMLDNLADILSSEEIDTIVAYLSTLKSE